MNSPLEFWVRPISFFPRRVPWPMLMSIVMSVTFTLTLPSIGISQQATEQSTTPESADLDETLAEILAGHSHLGEAFDEGPRQQAYLMGNTGDVHFPVTTSSKLAQQFVAQGIGQLHGFWYLEAERSFRQAVSLDKKCAMAYWGAAWAAAENSKRAKGLIAEAMALKDSVSKRERMYIEALDKFLGDKPNDKPKRAAEFLKNLESIAIEFPDDLEAKAFVVHRIWQNGRDGVPLASYLATDALLQQIFESNPHHPAHHYAIHLWDTRHPENALRSAAECGPAASGVAHMWHMPGHIYSRLKRYEDAIYQQSASARIDHRHMIHDRLLPDQIHNYAHNNEWLIRNLAYTGQVSEAIKLAENMVELPRHPKYNTFKKDGGSTSYGRRRLLQLLREYEIFDLAVELCRSTYLDTSDLPSDERVKTLRLLGSAAAILELDEQQTSAVTELKGLENQQQILIDELKNTIERLNLSLNENDDQPPVAETEAVQSEKAKKELQELKQKLTTAKSSLDQIDKSLLAIEGYQLVAEQNFKTAHQRLLSATGEDVSWLGELQFRSGEKEEGLKTVSKQVKKRPKEVIPLARLAFLQYENGDIEECKSTFEQLREASSLIEIESPLFARLQPIAELLKLKDDWNKPQEPGSDLGTRPPLETLGPLHWSPPTAPEWSLVDAYDQTVGSSELRGQPHVLIFYLGHGCLHCAEQLNAFAPRVLDFKQAGIKVLAVSSDDAVGLQESLNSFADEMPIRLAADEPLNVFKKFRAFDDFENQPLHGTFLIDGAGKIRWQDISYEPFMDHEFLLTEAKRLLSNELPDTRPEFEKVSQN